MCEAGTCCGCISLHKGCLSIGFITISISSLQTFIFSLILLKSYDSPITIPTNETTQIQDNNCSYTSYSIIDPVCPFGFTIKLQNITSENYQIKLKASILKLFKIESSVFNGTNFTKKSAALTHNGEFKTDNVNEDLNVIGDNTFHNLDFRNKSHHKSNFKREINNEDPVTEQNFHFTNEKDYKNSINNEKNAGKNELKGELHDFETDEHEKSFAPKLTERLIQLCVCHSPNQIVLWALVLASFLYAPIGVVLMVGIKKSKTVLLSTWLFYTVSYNLLALIVALTDGTYLGPSDVSSYIVGMIAAYCIIVVDSYYEMLLKNEKEILENRTSNAKIVKVSPNGSTGSGLSPISGRINHGMRSHLDSPLLRDGLRRGPDSLLRGLDSPTAGEARMGRKKAGAANRKNITINDEVSEKLLPNNKIN